MHNQFLLNWHSYSMKPIRTVCFLNRHGIFPMIGKLPIPYAGLKYSLYETVLRPIGSFLHYVQLLCQMAPWGDTGIV